MFSVIISHSHSDPIALWYTTTAIDVQLRELKVEWEYRIVSHGGDDSSYLIPYIESLKSAGLLGSWEHFTELLGSDTARQRASVGARGDILYFTEDHILIEPGFFKRALLNFDNGVDVLHTSLQMSTAHAKQYHYKLDGLETNFIGSGESLIPLDPLKTFRIGIGNMGAWFCRRTLFESIGGYGPDGLLSGYGAEEQYFDFKLAMLGHTNWLDPQMTHFHHAVAVGGKPRGYPFHFSNDYYRNLMTCALVIGGEPWLNKVYANFTEQPQLSTNKPMYALYEDAIERGTAESECMKAHRLRTLDEQLMKFKADGVAC